MSDEPLSAKEIELRQEFTALFIAWRRCVLEFQDPATPEERIREIEGDKSAHEFKLARQILSFPINVPCLIGDKLEVMAHYVNVAGELDTFERLIYTGLAALRVDVSHLV